MLFLIYADFECLIENILGYKNNLKKSSTAKGGEHTVYGFSISTVCERKKHGDCMENFFNELRKHAVEIIIEKHDTVNTQRE